jgi:ribonuclease PH
MLLDLDYAEDSNADIDMNLVMTGRGQLVEVQATAEGQVFSLDDLNKLVEIVRPAMQRLHAVQQSILKLDLSSAAK